jgi:hypothetical protein
LGVEYPYIPNIHSVAIGSHSMEINCENENELRDPLADHANLAAAVPIIAVSWPSFLKMKFPTRQFLVLFFNMFDICSH